MAVVLSEGLDVIGIVLIILWKFFFMPIVLSCLSFKRQHCKLFQNWWSEMVQWLPTGLSSKVLCDFSREQMYTNINKWHLFSQLRNESNTLLFLMTKLSNAVSNIFWSSSMIFYSLFCFFENKIVKTQALQIFKALN